MTAKIFLWDTVEEMDTLKLDSIPKIKNLFHDEKLLGVLENIFFSVHNNINTSIGTTCDNPSDT